MIIDVLRNLSDERIDFIRSLEYLYTNSDDVSRGSIGSKSDEVFDPVRELQDTVNCIIERLKKDPRYHLFTTFRGDIYFITDYVNLLNRWNIQYFYIKGVGYIKNHVFIKLPKTHPRVLALANMIFSSNTAQHISTEWGNILIEHKWTIMNFPIRTQKITFSDARDWLLKWSQGMFIVANNNGVGVNTIYFEKVSDAVLFKTTWG